MLYSSLCSFASFVTFTHCDKTAFLKIIQKCEQFVKNSSNCNYHKIDNVKTIQFDELFSNSNITWKICQIATFISSVMWNPDNLTSYFQIPISPENSSNFELWEVFLPCKWLEFHVSILTSLPRCVYIRPLNLSCKQRKIQVVKMCKC